MEPLVTSALIGAGASLAGTGASVASNAAKNWKQHHFWRRQMEESQKYQLDAERRNMGYQKELFDMENAYNRPDAQAQRMRAAGLNANLLTGVQPVSADAGTASASAPTASAPNVAGLFDGISPEMPYQIYMQAEQLKMQKELNDSVVRKNEAEAEATETDNKTREASNNLDLALKELAKTGADLDNIGRQLQNDTSEIQKYILDHTKDFEVEFKEYTAKEAVNQYQFNASERAWAIENQEDRRTQLKQEIIKNWLEIALGRLNVDKESVVKGIYTALAPFANDMIKGLTGAMTSAKEYFSGPGLSDDLSNFMETLTKIFSDSQSLLTDPLSFFEQLKDQFKSDVPSSDNMSWTLPGTGSEPDHPHSRSFKWTPYKNFSWRPKK